MHFLQLEAINPIIKHYFSGIGPEDLVKYEISEKDIHPYLPSNDALDSIGVELHLEIYYKKWIPQENYYYCAENTDLKLTQFALKERIRNMRHLMIS